MADLRRHNNLVSWIQIVQSKGHKCTHLSASSWWMGQGERRLRLALALGKLSKQRAPEWFCTHHTRAMHERKPAWDCINFCQYQDSLRGNVTHFPIDRRFLKNLRNAPRKKNTTFFSFGTQKITTPAHNSASQERILFSLCIRPLPSIHSKEWLSPLYQIQFLPCLPPFPQKALTGGLSFDHWMGVGLLIELHLETQSNNTIFIIYKWEIFYNNN